MNSCLCSSGSPKKRLRIGSGAALLRLACLMATLLLAATPLCAQFPPVFVSYSDGQVNPNNYSISGLPGMLTILSGTATQSGVLSGSGGIQKMGAGTLIFSAANTYLGSTHVQKGTLRLTYGGSITHPSSPIIIGYSGGGAGVALSVDGGSLSTSGASVGVSGASLTDTATVTFGSWSNGGDLRLGDFSSSTGVLNLGGGTVSTDTATLGATADALGIVNVSGGTLDVANGFIIGSSTNFGAGISGDFHLSGGAVTAGESTLGLDTSAYGEAHVSGGIWTITGDLTVGYYGSGALHLSGGRIFSGGDIVLGRDFTPGRGLPSSGVVNVSGGGLSTPNTLTVGDYGSATLNITGGGVFADTAVIGSHADSGEPAIGNGVVAVSGGSFTLGSGLTVGGDGVGTLTITDGGIVTVGGGLGTVSLGAGTAFGNSGTLNFGTGGAAGTLRAAAIDSDSAGSGIVNFNHTGSYTVNQVLTGTTLSVNQYAGTTVLNQANSYLGDTTVAGGTLELAFSSSATFNILNQSSHLVMTGGTLSLTGSGGGTQILTRLVTRDFTGSSIIVGADEDLHFLSLGAGTGSALHFDTSAGGADAGTSTIGTSKIYLFSGTAGVATGPGFTVTDSTGFGLATIDASYRVVRLTTTTLLPTTGATSGTDYRIDNHASLGATDPGSSSLLITASESARSITVDTTTAGGLLTLGSGVKLSSDVWNFGGSGSYSISGSGGASIAAVTPGYVLMINNYNTAPVTLGVGISDYGGGGVVFTGTGTTILTGVSTYMGNTYVSGGVLEVAAGGSISNNYNLIGRNVGGVGGNGVLNITGGSITDGGSAIGGGFGSTGTVNVSAGSWSSRSGLIIGGEGTGIVNLSGGSISPDSAELGTAALSHGTLNVSGGTWTSSTSLTVGASGSGVFNLSGGLANTGTTYMGTYSGSSGSASVSGGTWNISDYFSVGYEGTGILNISGTGSVSSALSTLGEVAGGVGTVNMSGGTWTTTDTLTLGQSGTGVLNLSGGTLSSVGVIMGGDSRALGIGTVSGGTWTMSADTLTLGFLGTAVLNVSGGSISASSMFLGFADGASGTVNMSGGSLSTPNGLSVGLSGSGVVTLSGGSLNSGLDTLGTFAGSSGTVTVSGGTWTTSGVTVGLAGTGVLNLTDSGTITIGGGTGTIILGNTGTGTINFGTGGKAGTLNAANLLAGIGSGTAVVNFNHTGDYTLNTLLAGNLTLNHTGPGTTTLTQSHLFTGPANVLGGTLQLAFGTTVGANILPTNSQVTLGSATLQLTGAGTQSLGTFSTLNNTAGSIVLGANENLNIDYLIIDGSTSALHFNTAAGGADADTGTLGSSVITFGSTFPVVITSPNVTVTDATGFGLAMVDANRHLVRITTTDLLPTSGADISTDYRIDNNAGTSTDAGSALLTVDTTQSARSITVDTSATRGVLTLGSGVILDTAVWNFGGLGANTYEVASIDPSSGITTTAGTLIQFNNYNAAPVAIGVGILENSGGPISVLFQGTGTTVLNAESTYTGNTTVTSGELSVSTDGTIGDAGGPAATTTIGSQNGDYARLSVTGGGYFEDSTAILGDGAGSTGIATVGKRSEWNHNADFFIGKNGTGVLNIIDGFSGTTGDVHIGLGAGSSGTVTVGSSSFFSPASGEMEVLGTLYVGQGGTGVLNIVDFGLVGVDEIKLGAQGTLNMGTGTFIGLLGADKVTGESSGSVVNFNLSPFNFPIPFTAELAGSLSVNKRGGGNIVLTTANTYTGGTSVLGGVLNLDFSYSSADIISSASALTLGGGTLVLSEAGTQTFDGLTTLADTTSAIELDSDETLTLGALTRGQNSALNFDVSTGGADGATVGTGIVILSGQTPGEVISPGFVVTDSTGFGLATVNADNQVIRLTTTDLLPASGAVIGNDYRIDNNGGLSTDPGSATLTIGSSQSARSITVDTTAGPGVLTLSGGAVLSTDIWNVGGYSPLAYAPYEITSTDSTSGITTATAGGMLRINNYAYDELVITAPILDNGGSGLHVSGPGTVMLNGDFDTYTGQTLVSGGASLMINGDHSTVTGTVIVQDGSILSGTGIIGGDIQVQAGGLLTAGRAGGCGCGGNTLNGTTVTFQNGSIFLVQDTGITLTTLHLTGAATIETGAVISFIGLTSPLTESSYTLISAASGLDAANPFTVDIFGIDPRYKLVYTGTELNLRLDTAPAVAYWTGAVDNKWSTLTGGTTNWATAVDGLTDTTAVPDTLTDVTFSATGAGLQQTDLDVDFSINSLTVNSPTTISTTTGPHTLTVATTTTVNDLLAINTDVTLISQGALTIGSSGILAGGGSVEMAADQNILNNGHIHVGDPTHLTAAAVLSLTTSGTGEITMAAGSTLIVNLYTGAGLGDNTALLSAADQLSLTGTLNATAGGTLLIGNPLGMTVFAGGDQWKVIDDNSGAGTITGKLAVNDSGLGLATGFVGSFDQATGIYSIADNRGQITAQTSGLPMASATPLAINSASQTATNDVNNHLFGLRSGGGEEGDDDDGGISASLDYGVIPGEGDGPESPMAQRIKRSRQWEVFTTVNYGNARLNPINTQSGVQIDSWASSVGVERHLSRHFTLGFAATFLQSRQTYSAGLGSLDLEGPNLSAYLSYVKKGFWSSLLYSFGAYDLGTTRNPGLGLPTAAGATNAYTHAIQFNTGWNFRYLHDRSLVTGPYAGIDYLYGTVDGYSETGGGIGALSYGRQTFSSLVTRIGWSVSKKFHAQWADITPQFRLGYERQNFSNNGTSVQLLNAPFAAAGGGQSPGQDYMVMGTGVNFQFTPDFSMLVGYQLQLFRDNMSSQFGSVRFSYKF